MIETTRAKRNSVSLPRIHSVVKQQKKSRQKISDDKVRATYPIVKSVAEGQRTAAEGKRAIEALGVRKNSAKDFVDNFLDMLKGEKYERVLSKAATNLYLAMIRRDYGPEALKRAIASVEGHCDYYEKVPKG